MKWIVERGSFEAPEYLRVCKTLAPVHLAWVGEVAMAAEFDTEAEAQAAAVETGVDELRITEKDE